MRMHPAPPPVQPPAQPPAAERPKPSRDAEEAKELRAKLNKAEAIAGDLKQQVADANNCWSLKYASESLRADREGPTLEQNRTQQVDDDDDDGQVKDGRKGRKSRDSRAVRIFGDSSLALNQVTGRWACNKRLWPYCQAAQDKVRQIRSEGRVVTLRHVRRCFNKEADSLSNVAMDRPEEEADLRLLLSESGGTAASTQSTTDGNAVLRPSMAPS